MKAYIPFFLSLVLLVSTQVFAHSDHTHPDLTEVQAISLAADVAKQLSEKDVGLAIGKIPESWASIPNDNIAIHIKGNGYYIIAVGNKIEKKTLYVLMSSGGDVYDANFSGEFKGLE